MLIVRRELEPILANVVEVGSFVFTAGAIADDTSLDVTGQTRQALADVDRYLALCGSDKTKILSATIWVADIRLRDAMNVAWLEWVDPRHLPARTRVAWWRSPSSRSNSPSAQCRDTGGRRMSNSDSKPAPSQRRDYRHFMLIPTRWMDNDIYGHVNNVVYYSYFDTLVNRYLIDPGGLDIHNSPVIGIAVETQCRFFQSFTYPETVDGGLRVGRLGNSSVRYEIGLFGEGEDTARAEGYFVHVFVDRATQRPVPVPASIRAALEGLLVS